MCLKLRASGHTRDRPSSFYRGILDTTGEDGTIRWPDEAAVEHGRFLQGGGLEDQSPPRPRYRGVGGTIGITEFETHTRLVSVLTPTMTVRHDGKHQWYKSGPQDTHTHTPLPPSPLVCGLHVI